MGARFQSQSSTVQSTFIQAGVLGADFSKKSTEAFINKSSRKLGFLLWSNNIENRLKPSNSRVLGVVVDNLYAKAYKCL